MPYYQRSWNAVIGASQKSSKNVRQIPVGGEKSANDYPPQQQKQTNVDELKVTYTRNMLKKQVEECQAIKAADPIKGDNNYLNYIIQKEPIIFKGRFSTVYPCFNHAYSENVMICRIFEPCAQINPTSDLYLKILRHLGKKHPCIIGTMDIFSDENRHIYLFQEYANRGNALEFMRGGNVVSELQMLKWAQSIYRAMDYLGDVGIAHRAIQPKHIMLKANDANGGEIQAKLSSFRSAIIYWDPAANDVIDVPCVPLSKRPSVTFQAPEVYGNGGEYFNPIEADVWSFGATMFYFVGRCYPYQTPNSDIEGQIRQQLSMAKTLSEGAKNWLYQLLRTNTKYRLPFDSIPQDPWFKSA